MIKTRILAVAVLDTYKKLQVVKQLIEKKYEAVNNKNAKYKLFDDLVHPYQIILESSIEAVVHFEALVAMLNDVEITERTLRYELDERQAFRIVNDEEIDENIEYLRTLPDVNVKTISALDIGTMLENTYSNIFSVYNHCDVKSIKSEIAERSEVKLTARKLTAELEIPFVSISKETRSALLAIKKVAKIVLWIDINSETVRSALSKIKNSRVQELVN